ncbi:hypothetical protein [Desulfobacca acetoxidans]|uniref:hypothetical protein n=1 Tax=Desulfobacca acetoxidans TaxID=60893 RepID=UPI00031DD77F|nr:hypothetical protein [Desulfobacca acetoxidans]
MIAPKAHPTIRPLVCNKPVSEGMKFFSSSTRSLQCQYGPGLEIRSAMGMGLILKALINNEFTSERRYQGCG